LAQVTPMVLTGILACRYQLHIASTRMEKRFSSLKMTFDQGY
jgi:hypothetical protein